MPSELFATMGLRKWIGMDETGITMNNRTYYSRDAEVRAQQERAFSTILLIALGLGIGIVAALMFAPQSGEKTRDELSHRIDDGIDPVRDVSRDAVHRLEHDFADLRKKVEDRLAHMR
jgi:hypothetical protein